MDKLSKWINEIDAELKSHQEVKKEVERIITELKGRRDILVERFKEKNHETKND